VISRTDSIGDVMLTLPMAGWLKTVYPKCTVVFLGRNYTRDVISACVHVDRFLSYDELALMPRHKAVERLREIRARYFFHVFPVKPIAFLALRARAKYRVGTRSRWYHWFTCNRLLNLHRRNSALHESQLNLSMLRVFDAFAMPSRETIHSLYGFDRIPSLPHAVQMMLDPDRKKVILHPASKGSAPEWGLGNYARLIAMLTAEKWQVIVGGTAGDREKLSSWLTQQAVLDLTGKLSLSEYISLISHCDALVAASTGPLHIAAALGKKSIGLFTSRRPMHPGRWAPVGAKAIALEHDPNCMKCAGEKACDCISSIPAERVLDLLRE
jgi:heptosyltransferase III